MVRADDGSDRIRELNALQNLRAHHGMNLHLLEFFRGELAGLGDDVFRHGELADIVQQGGGAQRFHFLFGEAQFFGDFDGINAHALQVIVRSVVLGFDGQGQSFDGAEVQRGNVFCVALFDFDLGFFSGKLGEIEMVGAVDPVNEGQNQERSLPANAFAEQADSEHHGGSNHVKGKGPEVAFGRNLVRGLAFGYGDDDGDGNGVGDKENQGGHDEKRKRARAENALQIVIGEIGEDDGVRHHAEDVEYDLNGN